MSKIKEIMEKFENLENFNKLSQTEKYKMEKILLDFYNNTLNDGFEEGYYAGYSNGNKDEY